MKNRKMGFSGFNFTEEAMRLAPQFCNEANASIYFKKDGCVQWIGKYRKVWIDDTRYISRPIRQYQKAPQNLLHLLFAFTETKIYPLSENRKVGMSCHNPKCVNPDHMILVRKYVPLESLYPDFVEEGEKPSHARVSTYVFNRERNYCKEFNNMVEAAKWIGTSKKLLRRYAKTGRLFKGTWYILRERNDMVEDESAEYENQEEIYGTRDTA